MFSRLRIFAAVTLCSAVFTLPQSANAVLVAVEDFDGLTPGWSNDSASQLFVDPTSSNEGLFIRPSTDIGTGNVLYGRDITGESGEPSLDPLVLTFSNIDITSYENVALSFAYSAVGFDGGDDIDYQLVLDGVIGSFVSLVNGANGGGGVTTSGIETVNIADTVSNLGLIVTVDQNGGSDSFELDDFQINGTAVQAIPEAGSVLFGTLICGIMGLTYAGRRMRKATPADGSEAATGV